MLARKKCTYYSEAYNSKAQYIVASTRNDLLMTNISINMTLKKIFQSATINIGNFGTTEMQSG